MADDSDLEKLSAKERQEELVKLKEDQRKAAQRLKKIERLQAADKKLDQWRKIGDYYKALDEVRKQERFKSLTDKDIRESTIVHTYKVGRKLTSDKDDKAIKQHIKNGGTLSELESAAQSHYWDKAFLAVRKRRKTRSVAGSISSSGDSNRTDNTADTQTAKGTV
jgi:hypothetical protein